MKYLVKVADKEFEVDLEYRSEKYYATINGKEIEVEATKLGESRSIMLLNNQSIEVDVRTDGYSSERTLFFLGQEIPVDIENFNLAQLKKTAGMSSGVKMETTLKAPMPGMILDVKVKVGDSVKKGDPLVIIEAMKMENVIKSAGEGVIKTIYVASSQSVEKDDRILEFE